LPVAYRLLRENKADEAIDILKMNKEIFPEDNSQIYHSLGEAYLQKGDIPTAKENYEKSLVLNPLSYSLIRLMQGKQ
jgi:tetratricopeptide (TPR) repeat protein